MKITRSNDYSEEENINERGEEFPKISNQNNYEYRNVIEEREITQTRDERRPYNEQRLNSPAFKKTNYPICRPFPLPKYSEGPTGYKVRVKESEFKQKTSRPMKKYIRRVNEEYSEDEGNLSQRYEKNFSHKNIPEFYC